MARLTPAPQSERLSFRPLAAEQLPAWQRLCAEPHIARFLFDGAPPDLAWLANALAQSQSLFEREGVGLWLLRDRDDATQDRWLGFGGFHHFPSLDPAPQLLYALTERARGRGLATEATRAMLRHVTDLGWQRVAAAVDAPNRASVNVLERAGFTASGVVPGAFGDTLLFEYTPTPLSRLPRTGAQWQVSLDHDWRGRALPDAEHVHWRLRSVAAELVVEVEAPYHADPVPASPPASTPRLWEHEVVELMLLGDDQHYLELELGPHGHYLVLALHGCRQVVAEGMRIHYDAHRLKKDGDSGQRWRGVARLPQSWLPQNCGRLAAFAMHGSGALRRHLSWRVCPGSVPDFHQWAAFAAFPPASQRK